MFCFISHAVFVWIWCKFQGQVYYSQWGNAVPCPTFRERERGGPPPQQHAHLQPLAHSSPPFMHLPQSVINNLRSTSFSIFHLLLSSVIVVDLLYLAVLQVHYFLLQDSAPRLATSLELSEERMSVVTGDLIRLFKFSLLYNWAPFYKWIFKFCLHRAAAS